jgi:hypothetical protein
MLRIINLENVGGTADGVVVSPHDHAARLLGGGKVRWEGSLGLCLEKFIIFSSWANSTINWKEGLEKRNRDIFSNPG